MAENQPEEALEKVLTASLLRVLDFVKFAEAKNGALLTFSSAWMVVIINLLTSSSKVPDGFTTALSVSLPLFVISAIICIFSFLPKMLDRFHRPADGTKSLLFFGDIATLPVESFHERVTQRYSPPEGRPVSASYLDDLCVQIAVNSRIAMRKFRMFNTAACFVLAAVALLTIPPLWWAIRLLPIAKSTAQ